MTVRTGGRVLAGIAALAAFCVLVGTGCLKGAGDDEEADNSSAVTNGTDSASTNDVTDETDDDGGATNGTDDVSGGETNETDEVVDEDDTPKVFVAIGDCLTTGEAHSGPSYPEMLGGMIGTDVINEGEGSDNSRFALARLPGILRDHDPDYLLILLGTMDATGQWPIDSFYENYYDMVELALDADCTPLLATIPPQLTTQGEMDRGMQLNAEIRRVAGHYGIPLVDLEAAFDFDEDLYLPDLWHPNGAGSEVIAEEFYRALKRIGAVE